jgi:hypothetical protein
VNELNLPGLAAWLRVAVRQPRNIVPAVAIVVSVLGCLVAYHDKLLGVIIAFPAIVLLAITGVFELRETARRRGAAEWRRATEHERIP